MIGIARSLPIVLINDGSSKKDFKQKNRKTKITKEIDKDENLNINEIEFSTYTVPVTAITKAHLDALKKQSEEYLGPFKTFIDKLIARQQELIERGLDESIIPLEEDDVVKLSEMISENGEFGSNKTAERIVAFAKEIFGGDKSKIDQIKDAIDKEFAAVQTIMGDIPSISQKTHDEVIKKLDKWANE